MLVSVIIVTYKRSIEVLMRAIWSALRQTYENIEVIVVNDDPENVEMKKVIEDSIANLHDDRIRLINHKRNSGACQARNTGIIASKGEFISLLDDDDEWLPPKIELQLEGFTNDNIGMVYSPFYNVKGELPGEIAIRGTKSGDLLDELLYANKLGGCSMSIIRREAFDSCGMFDVNFPASQDYDMWIRIAEKYEINYVATPLTRRYVMEESITRNFDKKQRGFELFMKKHIGLYEGKKDALNYRYTHRARNCVKQGQFKIAVNMLKKGIVVKPLSKNNVIDPLMGFVSYAISLVACNIGNGLRKI